jgi:predicted metal-dependent hydrolase
MRNDYLCVRDIKLPVKIYLEKRNNSRIYIGKKAIHIRIPVFMSAHEREKQISSFLQWARARLIKHGHRNADPPARRYKHGDSVKIGDETYLLHIVHKDKKSSSARIIDNTIFLSLSSRVGEKEKSSHIATLLSRTIGEKRIEYLREKIRVLNNRYFKKKVGKISFKYSKSRWGSCSAKGNINISTRLLFAPDAVLEYVCIHELAHLIERNHSKSFWALVKKVIPDYKEKEKWLKENQDTCWF